MAHLITIHHDDDDDGDWTVGLCSSVLNISDSATVAKVTNGSHYTAVRLIAGTVHI